MTYPTTYEEAVAYEAEAAVLVTANQANATEKRSPETRATLEAALACVAPGNYQHFKGGEYEVTGVVEDVNTGLCYVKYKAKYGAYEGVEALRVLVGTDSFLNPIDRAEYKGPRFIAIVA